MRNSSTAYFENMMNFEDNEIVRAPIIITNAHNIMLFAQNIMTYAHI